MPTQSTAFQFYDYHPATTDMCEEVLAGLKRQQRYISPKYFYDEKGSQIFDAICKTQAYYPTQTETRIIRDNIEEITHCIGNGCLLVEPGSGNSQKVRELLEAIQPHAYLPMDISSSYLKKAAEKLAAEYDWLDVHAVCADFTEAVDLPYQPKGPHRVAFFPGSSIGNFEPTEATRFLSNIAQMVGMGGGLLIGVDMKKSPEKLNAAYNDEQKLTESFNLNLLTRINRDLDADFIVEQFSHYAFYNLLAGRIEMHLVSDCKQQVNIAGQQFDFCAGESIHTENSYKYSIEEFQAIATQAGFTPCKVWTDTDNLFSLHYFEIK